MAAGVVFFLATADEKVMRIMRIEEIEAGPIPPNYAKVIYVGPEGETPHVEVMPTHAAFNVWGIDRSDCLPIKARTIFVVHPWGITIITFDDHGATSEMLPLQ